MKDNELFQAYDQLFWLSFKVPSYYPVLRNNIEKNIISFIHKNEPECTKSILTVIEMEKAYNSKHEEFKNCMWVKLLHFLIYFY